jgi:hypothetical protein
MSASIICLALRRSRRRLGPAPKGTKSQARILFRCLTTAALDSWASYLAKVAPSIAALADGAVNLGRVQAARGIRTIMGRRLPDGGGR